MEIWRNASPLTRRFFDQGGTNGEYGPNWVAGWLLYSVFRSRDVRNNRNRRKGESGVVADGEIYSFYCTPFTLKSEYSVLDSTNWDLLIGKKQVEETTSPKKGYYDPVRNGTL
jgi:hypothetical protein